MIVDISHHRHAPVSILHGLTMDNASTFSPFVVSIAQKTSPFVVLTGLETSPFSSTGHSHHFQGWKHIFSFVILKNMS